MNKKRFGTVLPIVLSVLLLSLSLVAAQTESTGFDIAKIGSINLVVGAVGIVLLILGFTKQGKSQGTGTMFLWIGGLAVALVLIAPSLLNPDAEGLLGFDLLKSLTPDSTPAATQSVGIAPIINQRIIQQTPATPVCGTEDTTVTLSAQDRYLSTAVGGQHAYRVGGTPISRISDAGTFTASPGDVIEILWGNATRTATYFSEISTETIPCIGTKIISREMVQNGTLDIDVFNEEGDLVQGTGGTVGFNETISAGDVVTLPFKIRGQFQRGLPHGGVIVADFNQGAFDDVIFSLGGQSTSVPAAHSAGAARISNRSIAYTIAPILSNQILDGTITLDAHNTNNPLGVALLNDNVNLTIYSNNAYVDEDTGGSFVSPASEDEDDVTTFVPVTRAYIDVD